MLNIGLRVQLPILTIVFNKIYLFIVYCISSGVVPQYRFIVIQNGCHTDNDKSVVAKMVAIYTEHAHK